MLLLSRKTVRSLDSEETCAPAAVGAVTTDDEQCSDAAQSAMGEKAETGDEGRGAEPTVQPPPADQRRRSTSSAWFQHLSFRVLPTLALTLALAAAWLKWQGGAAHETELARVESVRTATESAVALLSYKPDTVERDLDAARDRLTGQFRDSYSSLVNDVVAPGAKQKQVSAVATVPAAASVSVSPTHAVVLLFVNQTIATGNDAPTGTTSAVRVTLDKVDHRWLVSGFDPV